jgi:anti-sigma28 factor (negative regulator of flagellin synthesis)
MKVDDISGLPPRQSDAVEVNPRKRAAAEGPNGPAVSARSDVPEATSHAEAVRVTSDFGGMAEEVADPARQAKVAQLKEAVANNTYKPDSTEVAKAVYKELFL